MRRIVDIFFAALLLTLLCPLFLLVSALIVIDSPGPVFYRQTMVGWKGNGFSLFRFRTMHIHPHAECRLTRVGRFLRNYSLDHLPQLFNLLRGDLTIVGPRPMEASVVDLQDPTWQQYVQAKPGLVNYAIYKLGKEWTPSRATRPELSQELELAYLNQRTIASDANLFLQSLWKLIVSRGNIKARGEPDQKLKRDR